MSHQLPAAPDGVVPSMNVFLDTQSQNASSRCTSIIDSVRRNRGLQLRPVSAQPAMRFPTEQIFQIDTCLEPYISEGKCKPKKVNSLVLVPSSVISNADEYDLEPAEIQSTGIADAVRLPIDESASKKLCFSEALVVSRMDDPEEVAENDKILGAIPTDGRQKLHPLLDVNRLVPVGGMSINVDVLNGKFVINSATQFTFDGQQTAMATIQAEYTTDLEVQYEKRCETLCSREGKSQKYLEARIHVDHKSVEILSRDTIYEHCSKKTGHLTLDEAKDFMLDGGCFVLIRYLVQEEFIGRVDTFSALLSGEACRSTLYVSRKTNVLVNQRLCTVYKVRRVIWRRGYEPDMSISVHLESGHLVRHTWRNCPYLVHINPLQNVSELLEPYPCDHPLDRRWRDDAQLMGRFVEMRRDRICDVRAIVRAEPNLTAIIRDYLYCLLTNKPQNVLEFTVKHFTTISSDRCEYTVHSSDLYEPSL